MVDRGEIPETHGDAHDVVGEEVYDVVGEVMDWVEIDEQDLAMVGR